MRQRIAKRVRDLLEQGVYDQNEIFLLIHREFRTHYSVIWEEIHKEKVR